MTLNELSEQLIGDLSHGRRRAVVELSKIPGPEAFNIIIKALDDSDDEVRETAIYTLGDLKNPEALKHFLKPKLLFDENSNIRTATVRSLGNFRKIGGLNVISKLMELCNDPEWSVRHTAMSIIIREIETIKADGDTNSILSLLYILQLRDPEIHKKITSTLIEIGKESYDILLDALLSKSSYIKSGVVYVLGELKCLQARDRLIELINDDDFMVRREVAKALGQIGGPEVVTPLLKLLGDVNPDVRENAVKSIIGYGETVVDSLITELKLAGSKYRKKAIIEALGKIKSDKAVMPLIDALQDYHHLVRLASINALAEIGSEEVRKQLIDLISINKFEIEPLVDVALNSDSIRFRVRAIRALRELKYGKVSGALMSILINSSTDIVGKEALKALSYIKLAMWARICALQVLARLKASEAIPEIIKNLDDGEDDIVYQALDTIKLMKATEATEKVIALSRHGDPLIRGKAVLVLGTIGVGNPEVTDAVIERLKDEDREIRKRAARILGKLNDKKAVEPLKALIHTCDFWSVRRNACYALSNLTVDEYSVEEEQISRESVIVCPYKANADECPYRHVDVYCIYKKEN